MENRAVEISCDDWPNVQKHYLPETPQTILGLSTIGNYIRWNKEVGQFKSLTMYSLNGDWSDGTFVLVVSVTFNYTTSSTE